MMKKICALAVAVLLALGCVAFAETGDFMYVVVDGQAFVTGYKGADAEIVIPDELDGSPVTNIAGGAFINSAIQSVAIPASVVYIGDGAFMGCASLAAVKFEGMTCAFGKMVFEGCSGSLMITSPWNSDAAAYAKGNNIQSVETAVDSAQTYETAIALLSSGDCATAQEMFASLDNYEDSRDYYIYATARVYEQNGETDKAVALFSLVPGLLDAQDRTAALAGAQPAATASGGIVIGGMLGGKDDKPSQSAKPAPAPTPEPKATETPAADLLPFHEFIGDMPFEFDDSSKKDEMYTVYFYLDDFAPLDEYRQAFVDAGWTEDLDGPDADGWSYVYVTSPDGKVSFYIAYVESEGLAVFMYDSTVDYGFDPIAGL